MAASYQMMLKVENTAKTTGVNIMRMICRCCEGKVYRLRCLKINHNERLSVTPAQAQDICGLVRSCAGKY